MGAAARPVGRRWCYCFKSTKEPLLKGCWRRSSMVEVGPLQARTVQGSALLLSPQPQMDQGTIPASHESVWVCADLGVCAPETSPQGSS